MDTLKVIEGLFDPKKIKVLSLFLNDPDKNFYLREVATLTKVSPATTYRILNKLVSLKLIEQIKVKKFKLYKLGNGQNIKFLESILKESKHITDHFVTEISKINGVEAIIMQGEEMKDRANILIIGENIDNQRLKEISAELKEKNNFLLSALTLAREQYEQMSNMGLYSGKKKVLFRKK